MLEERKNIKRLNLIFAAFLIIVFLFWSPSAVSAGESSIVPDIETGKALSLTIRYTKDGNALSGVLFKTCKIADLVVKNSSASYRLTKEFASTGLNFDNMCASESNKAAALFRNKVKKNHISVLDGSTNNNGDVTFEGLDPGMYLVFQAKEHKQNRKSYRSDSFLVSVPFLEIGENANSWIYAVKAIPKAGSSQKLNPKKEIEVIDIKPQTSDNFNIILWACLFIGSGIVLSIGLYIRKKRGK